MNSFLDIIQSVILAGIIVLMVFGVHLITLKTGTENRVINQMQGIADATLVLIHEEIRMLNNFGTDSLATSSNSISFVSDIGSVTIAAFNDSLVVTKNGGQRQNYNLSLLDRSAENVYVFNLLQLDTGGNIVTGGTKIHPEDVDIVRVNLSISSRPQDLYHDTNESFRVDLRKDLFLRNLHLTSSE